MDLMYLLDRYINDRPLRAVTVGHYRWIMRRFIVATEVSELGAINREVVLKWRETEVARGLSAISFNAYVRVMRAQVNFAITDLKWPGANYFYRCNLPEPRQPKRMVSDNAVERARSVLGFFAQQGEWLPQRDRFAPAWFWRALLETAVYTGMRLRQLVSLRWGDLNMVALTIRLRSESSKTRREWDIPMASDLVPFLARLLQESERVLQRDPLLSEQVFALALFDDTWEGALTDRKVIQFFERLSNHVGCTLSVHRFRHALATSLMADPERNLPLVQALLGHADVRTTLQYVTPSIEAMRALLNKREIVGEAVGAEAFASRTRARRRLDVNEDHEK